MLAFDHGRLGSVGFLGNSETGTRIWTTAGETCARICATSPVHCCRMPLPGVAVGTDGLRAATCPCAKTQARSSMGRTTEGPGNRFMASHCIVLRMPPPIGLFF